MKKLVFLAIACIMIFSGCATVQSIIKSTFPYTATIIVPGSVKAGTMASATSSASSFDEIFGNQNGTSYIREVRISAAKLTASSPTDQSLGMFKSVKLFISSGSSGEVMVASRSDVQENIGNSLVLDIDNSKFLDSYIRGSNLKVRMEYVLRNNASSDVSLRAALNFTAAPDPK